jgi:hypothetical protein
MRWRQGLNAGDTRCRQGLNAGDTRCRQGYGCGATMTSSEVADKITKAMQSSAPMTTARVEMLPALRARLTADAVVETPHGSRTCDPSLPISSIKPKIETLISRTSP